MASDVTLKIDADTARYIAKISAASDETLKLNKHTKGIGGAWEHANEHLGKALLRGAAIATVFEKAAEAVNKIAEKSSEINKEAGGEALSRSLALSKIGAGEGARQVLENGTGGATNKERTQAAESLASFSETSRFKLDQRTIVRYFALINTGLYKSDELIILIKRGLPLPSEAEVADRLKAQTPEARTELAARSQERYNENARNDAYSSGGRNRAFQSARERAEAEHPIGYGVLDFVESAPGIGGVAKAAERTEQLAETNGILRSIANLLGRQSATENSLNLTGQGEAGN
jgi:hypothetical protein